MKSILVWKAKIVRARREAFKTYSAKKLYFSNNKDSEDRKGSFFSNSPYAFVISITSLIGVTRVQC